MQFDILEEVKKSAIEQKLGGPFGAVIYKDGEIVGKGVNLVLGTHDPTAHAEVVAIRDACRNLRTHDLSGCELYATGYPCPMCMSAIIWANIRKVYYSCDYQDAEAIGFRDSHIFNFLKSDCTDREILELEQVNKDEVLKLYDEFKRVHGETY